MCKCKWICKVNPLTGRHIKIGGPTDLKKAKPIQSGIIFEKAVSNRFKELGYRCLEETAGATSAVDVQVSINNQKLSVECKTKNAFEGGQISVGVKNDAYVFPKTEKGMLFKRLLGDNLPFSGKIPSFKKGDKSFARWEKEKHDFKGYYLPCDENAIADYYRQKEVNYIEIQDKGTYHTGEDVDGRSVPMFTAKTKVRIRCKQHGSSSMPGSIMISLNFDKRSVPETKRCFH